MSFRTRACQSWRGGPRAFFVLAGWVSLGAVVYHLLIAPLVGDRPFTEEFLYRLVHRVYELPAAAVVVAVIASCVWMVAARRHPSEG